MQPQHVFYDFEFVSSLLLPSGVTLFFLSSSVEDDSDTKKLSKEDKGRSAWRHQPFAVCVASAVAGYLIQVYRVLHFSPRFACESFMEPFSPLFCFSLGRCWDLGSKPVPQGWCVDVVQAPAFARAL